MVFIKYARVLTVYSIDLLHGAQRGGERKLLEMLDIGSKAKQ